MKTKNFGKKLFLTRTTVVNLNTVEMDNVLAGFAADPIGIGAIKVSNCCSNPCGSSTHVGCSGDPTVLT